MSVTFVVLAPAILAASTALLAFSLIWERRAFEKGRSDVVLADRDLYEKGAAAFRARSHSPSRFDGGMAERLLKEAGLEVRPARAIVLVVVLTMVVLMVSVVAGTGVVAAAVIAALVPCSAVVVVRKKAAKRRVVLDDQFARLVPRLAASVRGSMTLERAFRTAAASAEEPLKGELTRMLADNAYGMPLDQALEGMARRTVHADVRALAAAARIQQKRGGNIAEALDMIAGRMATRMKTAREIRTELAGTKMAKWVVAAAMPVLFVVMFAANADFARFYQQEPAGWLLVMGAAVFEAMGIVLSQRITSMESAVDVHGR